MTCNGPGEFNGWVRPLLGALYALAPDVEVTLFFVPDDYATGREAGVARLLFPQARIVDRGAYARFALGARSTEAPAKLDLVQYLGGDLMHAARIRARTSARLRTYKFARRRDARVLDRAYAVDAANARAIERAGIAPARIETIGNLAIDGARAESAGAGGVATDVLVLPGTRPNEVASLVPFFTEVLTHVRRRAPSLRAAFALSPFTPLAEVAAALAIGGDPLVWGARGAVVDTPAGPAILPYGGEPIRILVDAMKHAPHATLALTIPGTKCIELAALGVPTVVCVPLNVPEAAVINGALQYLDRLPWAGVRLKRAVVIELDRRFALTAQPNIDLGEAVMPELRGTLMPGEVARRVAAYAADGARRASDAERLRSAYAGHAGAAERLARSLLEDAS